MRERDVYEIWSQDRKQVYVGLSVNSKKRAGQHKHSKTAGGLLNSGGTMKTVASALQQSDAVEMERNLIAKYRNDPRVKCLNRRAGGQLGSDGGLKWTKEKVYEIAKGCKTRADLYYKSGSAYHAARRDGYLDEMFPKRLNVKRGKEEIMKIWVEDESLLYNTDRELLHENSHWISEYLGISSVNLSECIRGGIFEKIKKPNPFRNLMISNLCFAENYRSAKLILSRHGIELVDDIEYDLPPNRDYMVEKEHGWYSISKSLNRNINLSIIERLIEIGKLPDTKYQSYLRCEPLFNEDIVNQFIQRLGELLAEKEKNINFLGYDRMGVNSIILNSFIMEHMIDKPYRLVHT